MIVNYNKAHFEHLKANVVEFDVEYLNVPNPYIKNYIYLIDDNIAGLISFSIIYDRVELDYIWVDSNYRRMHIASQLIEFMFKNTTTNSYSLEVAVDNAKAINLYKKYNFSVVTIRKNYYNGRDAYLMVREMM